MLKVHFFLSGLGRGARTLSELFPRLMYWGRLPAFVGWLCLSSGMAAGWLWPGLLPHLPWFAIAGMGGVAALCVTRPPIRAALPTAVGFALMIGALQDQRHVYAELSPLMASRAHIAVCGTVISPVFEQRGSFRFLLSVDSVRALPALSKRTLSCISAQEPAAFTCITVVGTLRAPQPARNPGAFDGYTNALSQGIWGTLLCDSMTGAAPSHSPTLVLARVFRSHVLSVLSLVADEKCRLLLQASFLGDDDVVDASTKDAFRVSGLYHLLALSGSHVIMIAAFVFLLLAPVPVNRSVKICIVVGVLWLYLAAIGPIPSLVRATIMATLVLASYLVQRRNHALNALGLAGVVWLCLEPLSLFTASYQLSFAATMGLIVLVPPMHRWVKRVAPPTIPGLLFRTVAELSVISLGAFVATAPVIVWHFGALSLLGLIANITGPLFMSGALWSLLVGIAAHVVGPWAAFVPVQTAALFAKLLIWNAKAALLLPSTAIPLPLPHPVAIAAFVAVVAGIAAIRRDRAVAWAVGAGGLALIVVPATLLFSVLDGRTHVVFFDAPGTNLAAVRFADNSVWIVGTAPQTARAQSLERVVAPWLRRFPFARVETLVVDGRDPDAVHWVMPVLARLKPRTIVAVGPIRGELPSLARDAGVALETVEQGAVIAAQCTSSVVDGGNGRRWLLVNAPECRVAVAIDADTASTGLAGIRPGIAPRSTVAARGRNVVVLSPGEGHPLLTSMDASGAVTILAQRGVQPRIERQIAPWRPVSTLQPESPSPPATGRPAL